MASVVKIKRSSIAGKRPTTSNIQAGELALNLADGRLFSSNGSVVFEIGANTHSLYVGAGGLSVGNGAISFPTSDGTDGQALVTDGEGQLSFVTIPTGPSEEQFATSSTSNTIFSSFSKSSYRSAKYELQITTPEGFYRTELAVLHDGVNAYTTETGTISTANVGVISVGVTASNVDVAIAATNSDTKILFVKTLRSVYGNGPLALPQDLQTGATQEIDLQTANLGELDLNAGDTIALGSDLESGSSEIDLQSLSENVIDLQE